MKLFFLILSLFIVQQTNFLLCAQVYTSGTPVEGRVQIQVDELKERLKLSEEQVNLLKEILLKFAKTAQEKRHELGEASRDSIRAMLTSLENEKNTEVKTILTQEQFDEYIRFAEEQRLMRRERYRR